MNSNRPVKVIKSGEGKPSDVQDQVESVDSTAVRSWVVEYKERDRGAESTPAFDSLFKEALPD